MKNNLNELRQNAGLTLNELATHADLSISCCHHMETEDANPTIRAAYAVSQVLDISVYEIWPCND